MRKTRRFNGEDGSSVNERGEKRFTATPDSTGKLAEPTKPLPRERIITKEQVEAKGFTNLRDFLNAEKNLKRKDGKPAKSTSSVSGDDLSKYYADQKKPAAAKPAEATAKPAAKKEEGNALAFVLPAAVAAAAAFGANKMAKKEEASLEADKAARDARAEREYARLQEARATTAKAEKTAKESIDTKAKRGMSKTGGGGGGRSARSMQLGADLDPKGLTKDIEFKRGGKIRRFAAGGEVAAKKAPEPPISKATQESMKRQAAQAKIDRKQAEEQKAGEREVRENMGRIGFKKGGSASKRADGCAIRGKTRA